MTSTEIIAPRKLRGFALLPPDRLREISALGGRSVPRAKRAFVCDAELASAAGRKGGLVSKRKTV